MEIINIKHGETHHIQVQPEDENGNLIVMDETWSAACRVTTSCVGGTFFADVPMVIEDGMAKGEIDTGESPWQTGSYFYDVRITDPSADDDFWTDPTNLIVGTRNSPPSA